jgi:hypothetical protein
MPHGSGEMGKCEKRKKTEERKIDHYGNAKPGHVIWLWGK